MSLAHVLVYTPRPGVPDVRSCSWIEHAGSPNAVELYRFLHDQPPDDDNPMMTARTIFYRFNENTSNYEYAGEINWGLHQSMVTFGTAEPRSIREMRQAKTPGKSQSRRFTWNGHQYKWKRGEAQNDLQCFTVPMLGAGKLVASFEGSTQTLTVEARAREDVIDQIVVLCVVHLFLISAGKW